MNNYITLLGCRETYENIIVQMSKKGVFGLVENCLVT